jgi:hypothetical protein
MQPIRRLLLVTPLLFVLAAGGCAGTTERGLKQRLDPLVGKADKWQMIERYGEPVDKKQVDSTTDVWEFVVSDQAVPTGNAASVRTSTRLRATFKNGVLSAWSTYNAMR